MTLAQADSATARDDRDDGTPIDPARRSALLEDCSGVVISRLSEAIADALQKVGEELTGLALRNTSRAAQQALLDAVTLVRSHHAEIELRFRELFADIFARRIHGEGDAIGQAPADELALVDDSVIEEKIAIDRIVQRARSKLDPDEVLGIRARLGVLAAGDWFDETRHPAAPEAVFEALRRTLNQLQVQSSVRDALLDAIEPHVSSNLGEIYSVVNERLRSSHVLPRIRPQVVTAGGRARRGEAASADGMPAMASAFRAGAPAFATVVSHPAGAAVPLAGATPGPEVTAATGPAFDPVSMPVSGFSPSVVPGISAGGTGATVAGGGAEAETSLADPLDPFTVLQAKLAEDTGPARRAAARVLADPASFAGGVALPAVAPVLLDSLSAIQAGRGPNGVGSLGLVEELLKEGQTKGSPLDRLTVEIVSLVFDQLYADKRLPDTIKQQLLRLQVVAVKAALIDRSFFASRRHPMRRLLDEICRAASDPDVDTAAESALVGGVAEIVDWLIASFESDLSVFEDAATRLELLLSIESQRRAERDAELARQAERLEALNLAQEQARDEIRTRVVGPIPAFLADFFDRCWYRVMAVLRVDDGDDAWRDSLDCIDKLVWSVLPKESSEIPRLASMLPALIGQLGRGLGRAGVEKGEQERFFNELLERHTEVIQRAKADTAGARRADRPADPVASTQAPAAALPKRATEAPVAPEIARQLGELRRGDALELLEPDGTRRRFRLSWVSPTRRLFILTRHPEVARPVERAELARWLATGRARIAESDTAVEQTIATIAAGKAMLPA